MSRSHNWVEQVLNEYRNGIQYKNALGQRGLYEQSRINERFYSGDQWHGVTTSGDRPLVRHNVIKRIADYKLATVGASPVAVTYSAEGLPLTADLVQRTRQLRLRRAAGDHTPAGSEEETALVMEALSGYFRSTAERVRLNVLQDRVLRNAYISGTGVLYSYWDDTIPTGLYADHARSTPIRGDVSCEVLDVENVYFGDPAQENVQDQPYILIARRRSVEEVRREARRFGCSDWKDIQPDEDILSGETSSPLTENKVTELTRFWKEWDDDHQTCTVKAVRICRGAVIRKPWDLGIRLYPISTFVWGSRRRCAYGDSEITFLIPNQIAINRTLSASVWAVMMMGMPIMVVNGDVVTQPITNDPGQIVQVFGGPEDCKNALSYVDPPAFSPQFDGLVNSLIANTLSQAGATDAALGDVTPTNTSAIIQIRQAAALPLQTIINRYYACCSDLARIWAEFWINHYGTRPLKIEDEHGVWYLPFDGDRYRHLLLSVRTSVSPAVQRGEAETVQVLDGLLDKQAIDSEEYLERLPVGLIPNKNRLLRDAVPVGSEQQKGEGA